MDDLTAFQRDILYVINGSNRPSGQCVLDKVQDYYEEQITHSQLYSSLDTLAEKELAEKGEIDGRTNYYAITNRGIEAIHERRKWENQYAEV